MREPFDFRPEDHVADLVVVGGGMSGLCAAIAAARAGAEVMIIQERPVFGGSGSSEIRVPVSGAASSNAWSAEGGLIHEIMLHERARNAGAARSGNVQLDLILDEYLESTPALTVWRSTVVHGIETGPGNRISAVHALQLGSERRIRVQGKQFIDATGDGTLAAMAGARTRYGREARDEHSESLAPLQADSSSLGSTITMQARRLDHPVPFRAPDWVVDYRSQELSFDRTVPHIGGDVLSGFWWIEVNDPFHQIHDTQAIRHQLHRHVLGLWDHLKNHSDRRDELENFHLEWIGHIPGKRESRRIVGDVTLTQEDVVGATEWYDEIGGAGWWIDLHIKGGVSNLDAPAERENVDLFYRGLARVSPFSVPLRACYSADVPNLWVTGRCISATHVGLGPIRVQQTLAQLGQSVGTAAAIAIASDRDPREFSADTGAVAALQQQLLREGVRLLDVADQDPLNLAARAAVSGPATALTMPEDLDEWLAIGDGRAQVIPEMGSSDERTLWLRLRNRGAIRSNLRVVAEPIRTIWDRHETAGELLAEVSLPGGADDWYPVTWSSPVVGTPVRIAVYDDAQTGTAEWAAARGAPTGTLSESLIVAPGGPEPRNAHLPAFAPEEIQIPVYRLWRQ